MKEELPAGWVLSRLEELTKLPKQDIVDGPFGSNLKASEYVEQGIPIVRLQNVDRDNFLQKNIRYVSLQKAKELSRHSFRAGDVIITKLGDPVGKACVVPDRMGWGIIVADVVRARISQDRATRAFVSFAINSPLVVSQINLEVKGSTRPRVNLSHIRSLQIPLAPLNEQRRIVAKLEKLLAKVDACRERLEKVPVILKRFRQSVLAAACSGRLTADWRKQNPAIETADELLKRLAEDADFMDADELPHTWVRCHLKFLSELITKGASPKWQGVNYSETGVLFVTSENVGWGQMLLERKKYVEQKINEIQPRSILRRGDVLTNIVGASIGRSAIYDSDEIANMNQAVALVRLRAGVEKSYIVKALNSPPLIGHMHHKEVDVARANLSLADVQEFPIPLPPLPEQHEIARRVEAMFALADQIEARYRKAKAHVDRLTQSILAKAFRGELVPQDPNDEPASKLLERIKSKKDYVTEPKHKKKRGR